MIFSSKKIKKLEEENERLLKNNACIQELNAIRQREIKSLNKTIKKQEKELQKLRYVLKVEKSFR